MSLPWGAKTNLPERLEIVELFTWKPLSDLWVVLGPRSGTPPVKDLRRRLNNRERAPGSSTGGLGLSLHGVE